MSRFKAESTATEATFSKASYLNTEPRSLNEVSFCDVPSHNPLNLEVVRKPGN
jgi:hypothetical protein